MHLAIRSCFALFFALAVPAQTFIVDAAGGPGTNFTDLPPAIAAVPDGAILLVRPGTYGPIALNGKGLSILATAPGVDIASPNSETIIVLNLTAAQAFTLRDVRVQQGGYSVMALVQNCAGPVLLDGYQYTSVPTFLAAVSSTGVRVQGCPQVVLRNCTIQARHAVEALNSTVVAEQCELRGHDAFFFPHVGAYAGVGIQASSSSRIELSRCRVFGGAGLAIPSPLGPPTIIAPQSAVMLYQSFLRLSEDASGIYQAGQLAGAIAVAAIGGNQGTVVRSPQATLLGSQGGPAVAPGFGDTVRPLPSLRTISAPPGGTVNVDVTTPPGEPVFLLFGLPMPPVVVPGFDGTLWLDPGTVLLAAAGVPQPAQPLTASLVVPSLASLVGARFGWQALAWTPADGFRVGNPSIYAH